MMSKNSLAGNSDIRLILSQGPHHMNDVQNSLAGNSDIRLILSQGHHTFDVQNSLAGNSDIRLILSQGHHTFDAQKPLIGNSDIRLILNQGHHTFDVSKTPGWQLGHPVDPQSGVIIHLMLERVLDWQFDPYLGEGYTSGVLGEPLGDLGSEFTSG
eukprot:scaffold4570_cov81-Cylindrotheca_fusiformis.AAC.8